ncbi:uncharacterized protein [Euphorbia lathyris]|uniref:uncharacterized protein n=1 Tax=Euphorbia lathyris TaxID=212925 RepID=UPI003313679E
MENSGTTGSGSPFKHLRMENIDTARIPPSSDAAAGHFKKKSRRKFVRLIKAVLFETSLANKIKKRAKKKKQIANGDSASINDKDTYPITATTLNKKFGKKNQGRIISGTPSIETSSISSSSCASSIASSSMRFPDTDITNLLEQQKQKNEEKGKGYYGINTGLCLILVALLVLVVWGKLFAILCTSAWLFFLPNWSKGKMLLKGRLKAEESMDREEYNKKIIMEGLLDRKRS